MVRKLLKWLLLLAGGLTVLLLIFYSVVYFKTNARITKVYDVSVHPLTIPSDSASYAKGRHIAENRGCIACHGANLSGEMVVLDDKSPVGLLYASNITSGKGGIQYTDEDWQRVLRHGINKNNQSVWFMPSHDICQISNEELGALISYVKSQPPVDHPIPEKKLKPLGRVLVFLDKFPLLPAEMIDHAAEHKDKVIAEVSPVYGAYLATTCRGCHGADLKGGPAHAPNEPDIPNISATSDLANWREADFINTLRTGKTPAGRQLSEAMPYKYFTYTDDELKAILMFLQQSR